MNAISVDDLFERAWAEYENLEHEIRIFIEENSLNYDFFKVEMSGPYVKIKHTLPDILWTEELHDLFCETFGVHLQSFERSFRKTQKKKPALGGFKWVYGAQVHHEKFIVPYNELPLGSLESSEKLFSVPPRCGKSIDLERLQLDLDAELEKRREEQFHKSLKKMFNRCPYCHAELNDYWDYRNAFDGRVICFQYCKNCGKRVVFERGEIK